MKPQSHVFADIGLTNPHDGQVFDPTSGGGAGEPGPAARSDDLISAVFRLIPARLSLILESIW
jgi:hypothetical protein